VDLGSKRQLNCVKLRWEAAYGKGYEIRVSDDAMNWTTLFSTANGNGGLDDLSVTGSGRYVKMRGLQRGTSYGYSLYEFEAYGK
jgi:hexosaminidase